MTRQQNSSTSVQSQNVARAARNLRPGPGNATGSPRASSRSTSAPVSDAIRVLCVDDHEILIEGLKAQFAIDGGVTVVGRLPTAARMIEEVDRLSPHAVLLDIEMPGPDAFEMADRLKRAHPDVRIIVLSAHIRDTFISAAFASGVCAYFSKSDELDDIVRGIHDVMRSRPGAFVLGPKVRQRCQPVSGDGSTHGDGDAQAGPPTRLASLTPREADILRLIGKGLSRVQIARELCRSPKTIDAHQTRMMKKIGITNRSELMRFAIREGLATA